MNIQQILGISFLALGLVSVSSYIEDLAGFRIAWFYKELKPMQERWGRAAGTIMHIGGYVIAPIGFGILFLMGIVFPL
jgi:hypothetical protein